MAGQKRSLGTRPAELRAENALRRVKAEPSPVAASCAGLRLDLHKFQVDLPAASGVPARSSGQRESPLVGRSLRLDPPVLVVSMRLPGRERPRSEADHRAFASQATGRQCAPELVVCLSIGVRAWCVSEQGAEQGQARVSVVNHEESEARVNDARAPCVSCRLWCVWHVRTVVRKSPMLPLVMAPSTYIVGRGGYSDAPRR